MTRLHKKSVEGVYTLIQPAAPCPLVFDSPHSGTLYPPDFDYACDFATLEKAEDKYVDELFAAAPTHGAAFLCAEFPRSYIDVNRCERDIDVDLLEDIWPEEINPTARSHAGIGLIRRLVRPGVPLYNRSLKAAEIRYRIERYYRPYHNILEKLVEDAHYRFGQVWHINCHSMPTQTSRTITPDFVLGDRDGTTCDSAFTRSVRDFLRGLGYRVTINDPYKGVELVRRYSNPATGRQSLQIEIARHLYMDEETSKKSSGFDLLKDNIESLIRFIAGHTESKTLPVAAD